MMTDPIADMLTRIRNAVRVERPTVDVPFSKVKRGLADVLKKEGFIWKFYNFNEVLEKVRTQDREVLQKETHSNEWV